MKYTKGYRFRLYPNKEQIILLNKTLGCSRFVFNHFLNIRKTAWEEEKKSVAYSDTSALLTQLKADAQYSWLKEVDSIALQQSLRDLDAAYQNFFKHDRGYPKFKSKRHHRLSYRTTGKSIRVEGKKLRLPKVGAIPFVQSREFSGRILNATVTRTASGKYFVSLCVEDDLTNHLKVNAGDSVGLDVGLKEFCTTSQGKIIANPKILRGLSRKLARAQRCLSRRKLDSRNRYKQRIFLARIHERIAQTRLDFLHKLTTQLCRKNQTIAVESLNIQGMLKNHSLARAISDASWGEFFRQLQYKAFLYGCDVIKVPTFYPSSQTCSACGFQNSLVKNLSIREWRCPKCGTHHDRDTNAAINILKKATVGHTGSYACGETVRRVSAISLKQESLRL